MLLFKYCNTVPNYIIVFRNLKDVGTLTSFILSYSVLDILVIEQTSAF